MSSSETITRTDLTNILNEVLPVPRGAYTELLWTNPNGISSQTSTMGTGETEVTLSKANALFDGFFCEFRCFYNKGNKTYGYYFTGASGMFGMVSIPRDSGNPVLEYQRSWWVSGTNKMTFSDCVRVSSSASNVTGSDTGCLVPLRIWGIKLHGDDINAGAVDYIVEQGTSGIWTYRKWNSGIAECWGNTSWAISSWSRWGSSGEIYYSNYSSAVLYPSGLFVSPPMLQTSACTSDSYGWLGTAAAGTISQTSTHFWLRINTGSTSQSAYIGFHAKGTWK